jgi:hypothetical protein
MLQWRAAAGSVLLTAAVLLGLVALEAHLAAGGEPGSAAATSGLAVIAAVVLTTLLAWIGERLASSLLDRLPWRRAPGRLSAVRPDAQP